MSGHALRVGACLVLAIAVAALPAAAADRGLQITPNGAYVLVNKDVGAELWAITLNNANGTATGNVFQSGGGPPLFIACNPLAQPNGFSCFGADACSEGGAQRGIQTTPDGLRVLVNKDVGADRWAISLNDADGTAVGNVFRAGGGPPAFISCTPTAAPNGFSCFGADACAAEPCGDEFSFIGDVTLPSTFFQVPAPCTEQFSFIANVTLPDDFFRLSAADDFLSDVATATGVPGSLRVGAAPIPGLNSPAPISGVQGNTNVSPGGTNEVAVSFDAGGGSAAETETAQAAQGGTFLIVAVADGVCAPGSFASNFYEIPLQTTAGQVVVRLTFSEDLQGEDFVLCFTIVSGGVVGQYAGFTQSPSPPSCGNGVVEGGEVCDPPAAQAQCPGGRLCSNNCGQCVLATSCAGRCCPGRDDTCTAPSAPCFCDEFCVTAQDCCEDALEECGFGPAAPTISGLTQQLVQLNACNVDGGPAGSIFAGEFDFTDPDGDVTQAGSAVLLGLQFVPSGVMQSLIDPSIDQIAGNASAGTIQVGQCYRFGNDSSVNVSFRLRDAGAHVSNTLTINTPRPQGAN